MNKITSRENLKFKLAKRVREGREKQLIFIEGVRLAEEVLRSSIKITEIFISENFLQNERLANLIDSLTVNSLSINAVSEKLLQSLADTKQSQGIILLCQKPSTEKPIFEQNLSSIKTKLPVVIFLNEINNPSNLGAILRTAEAVDAAGIIISKGSAEPFSPKALRASMGAGLRLNIRTNADFNETLNWAREKSLIVTAADINAEKSYEKIDWSKPRLLVFGSEAHGLNAENLQRIDEGLLIPMENEVESLNLAVSCGIILFEGLRQIKNRQHD